MLVPNIRQLAKANWLPIAVAAMVIASAAVALPARAESGHTPDCGGSFGDDNRVCLSISASDVKLTKNKDINQDLGSVSLIAVTQHSYGSTLTMQAKDPDLVNEKDPSQRITSTKVASDGLAANQWGVVYAVAPDKKGKSGEVPPKVYEVTRLAS